MKKLLVLLMVGLLSVVAFADIQTGYDPTDDGDKLRFGDGNELVFGGVASFRWEDGDANAMCLLLDLPAGGSVDVPAFVAGIDVDDEDLGLFNGKTAPGIYILDTDGDSYVGLTWVSDDNPEIEVGGNAATITIPGVSGYTITDDTDFGFGTSDPVTFEWTSADANAMCLILDMPAGGATDVPGFGLVTTDADFGYFNGYTAPFFFIEDDDGDTAISLEWATDDVPSFNVLGAGTYFRFVDTVTFGVDDTDVDVQWFGETSGDSVLFDGSEDDVTFEDITLELMDDTVLAFGDAADATIQYDENGDDDLQITGTVGFDGNVNFGASGGGVDVYQYGVTSGDFVMLDASGNELIVEDIKVNIMDDTTLTFGDGDDFTIDYDEGDNDNLVITSSATAAAAIGDPLVAIILDDGGSGMTANQEVFGVARGSAGATDLLQLDEDGDLTIAGTATFSTGQTRKVRWDPKDVELDGSSPASLADIGTDGQCNISSLVFDADGGVTGDDLCYITWHVPDGYVVDSARLNVAYMISDALDASDEAQFDFAVNAVAPGEVLDAAGTALADQSTVISDASSDNGKLHVTQYNIEVEDIAVDDLVTIEIAVDESASAVDAGTFNVLYLEIEYESTE